MTWASTYTHDAYGQRVDQYALPADPLAPYRADYQRSGFRNFRSTLQAGQSADNMHVVEQWGQAVMPYEAWRFPFRPYGVPYDAWGPQAPYGIFNGNVTRGGFPGGGFPGGGFPWRRLSWRRLSWGRISWWWFSRWWFSWRRISRWWFSWRRISRWWFSWWWHGLGKGSRLPLTARLPGATLVRRYLPRCTASGSANRCRILLPKESVGTLIVQRHLLAYVHCSAISA